ncbi:MAG: TIGR03643 family protein [Methylotenera sp.]|nr:TIGR03643 family protein [Oligoflexia bacterium]
MAWEDRTPFDAILTQFGLKESETIEVMRRSLAPARFRAWRKRVHENGKLKDREARNFDVGVFKSSMQRTDGSTKKQK